MIAFVFWSSPAAAVATAEFESHLRAFHEGLSTRRPDGFRVSASFRTEPTPWTPRQPPVYEDWYVVSTFAGVDHLIDAVKETDRVDASSPHTHLIQHTDMGMGAIFALRAGQPQLRKTPHAWWFDASSAADVEGYVRSLNLPGRGVSFSLWIRSLGLGPVKCCLQASEPLSIWGPYDSVYRSRIIL